MPCLPPCLSINSNTLWILWFSQPTFRHPNGFSFLRNSIELGNHMNIMTFYSSQLKCIDADEMHEIITTIHIYRALNQLVSFYPRLGVQCFHFRLHFMHLSGEREQYHIIAVADAAVRRAEQERTRVLLAGMAGVTTYYQIQAVSLDFHLDLVRLQIWIFCS